jgi:hypothetical protein
MDGDLNPYCSLPDASNGIDCMFYYGWLEGGGLSMEGPDGYRFLSYGTALKGCQTALWSVGPNLSYHDVVAACARALLAHRWMNDAGIYDPETP